MTVRLARLHTAPLPAQSGRRRSQVTLSAYALNLTCMGREALDIQLEVLESCHYRDRRLSATLNEIRSLRSVPSPLRRSCAFGAGGASLRRSGALHRAPQCDFIGIILEKRPKVGAARADSKLRRFRLPPGDQHYRDHRM